MDWFERLRERATPPLTLGNLLRKQISRDNKVLFIGSFGSPANDPAPLFALGLTDRVHIVESKSDALARRVEKSGSSISKRRRAFAKYLGSLPTAGESGHYEYRLAVKKLVAAGCSVSLPRLHTDNAATMRRVKGKFDVLVDAGSFPWVVASNALPGQFINNWVDLGDENPVFGNVLKTYARVANKLVFYHSSEWDAKSISRLRETLAKMGATVTNFDKVANLYQVNLLPPAMKVLETMHFYAGRPIVVDGNTASIRHKHDYTSATVADFGHAKETRRH